MIDWPVGRGVEGLVEVGFVLRSHFLYYIARRYAVIRCDLPSRAILVSSCFISALFFSFLKLVLFAEEKKENGKRNPLKRTRRKKETSE